MNVLLLDLDASPAQRGDAVHAWVKAALSRLRIKLAHERCAADGLPAFVRQAAWRNAEIVMVLAGDGTDPPLSSESLAGKAILQIYDGHDRTSRISALVPPPPLADDHFPLGKFALPGELVPAAPAVEVFRVAIRQATIWVTCKRHRDESLALAEIYAAAPIAATAF